jgi:hypothetical protein
MKLIKLATATALVAFSAGSFAAKPTSIVFVGNAETGDGTPYATYNVKCSNGKKMELTAWDNRRKWCVGIKAAKAACKGQ